VGHSKIQEEIWNSTGGYIKDLKSARMKWAGARNAEWVPIKFGIEPKKILEIFEYAHKNGLLVDTLHFHIGSGWLRPGMEAFRQALRNGLQVYRRLLEAGFALTRLDVGGGAGIRGRKEGECFPWDEYAAVIASSLKEAKISSWSFSYWSQVMDWYRMRAFFSPQ
jgi:arginine decarboxylase-like protein